jgi:hypothetical protein
MCSGELLLSRARRCQVPAHSLYYCFGETYLNNGVVSFVFCQHNPETQQFLLDRWVWKLEWRELLGQRRFPLLAIRNYFGEKVPLLLSW